MGQVGSDQVGDVRRHLEQLMRALPGRIRAAGVPAIELGGMLTAHGALDTARRLARPGARPYGFLDLHQVGRLDLSVEALVVTERFRSLFTAREVEYCELRLEAFDVDVAVVRRGEHLGRPTVPPEPRWVQLCNGCPRLRSVSWALHVHDQRAEPWPHGELDTGFRFLVADDHPGGLSVTGRATVTACVNNVRVQSLGEAFQASEHILRPAGVGFHAWQSIEYNARRRQRKGWPLHLTCWAFIERAAQPADRSMTAFRRSGTGWTVATR